MMIAADAISLNAILVTNNEKEFKRIENLKLENWLIEWLEKNKREGRRLKEKFKLQFKLKFRNCFQFIYLR